MDAARLRLGLHGHPRCLQSRFFFFCPVFCSFSSPYSPRANEEALLLSVWECCKEENENNTMLVQVPPINAGFSQQTAPMWSWILFGSPLFPRVFCARGWKRFHCGFCKPRVSLALRSVHSLFAIFLQLVLFCQVCVTRDFWWVGASEGWHVGICLYVVRPTDLQSRTHSIHRKRMMCMHLGEHQGPSRHLGRGV